MTPVTPSAIFSRWSASKQWGQTFEQEATMLAPPDLKEKGGTGFMFEDL